MHACTKKNFIGVKIADAGDQLLVEQNCFHAAAMRSKNAFEFRETEIERVRTDAASLQKFIRILDQLDLTKFSLIVERQPAAIHETKNNSRSFQRYFVAVEVLK